MADHKYRVGQAVKFFQGTGRNNTGKGGYTIVRLFPVEGNIPQYRIKSSMDGHERMALESELAVR